MKKAIAIILSIIFVLAITFPTLAISTVAVKSIKLDSSQISLKVGQTSNLKVTFTPANTTQKLLTYVTGNKKIVTVDATGKITGVGEGTTTITVYSVSNKKIFATCNVTISLLAYDPLKKYNPPIEITMCRNLDANLKFLPGESINNNVWSREYENVLGIKIKYVWTTPADQYSQKLNMAIASNDLPDIFYCKQKDFNLLKDTGRLADLTDAFNKYASPQVKKYVSGLPEGFDAGKVNGKLLGFSNLGTQYGNIPELWIRDDWMKKFNLSAPKTMDDVLNMAEIFTTKDPDGNGKNDTYGIGLANNLNQGYASGFAAIDGIANAYHAYPFIWIKDSTGKLVYGSIQPEMKKVLQTLQVMYKLGLIDKEFAVKNRDKVCEEAVAGKFGIEFGTNWNASYPLISLVQKNKDATWSVYPIVSADNKPALAQEYWPVDGFAVATTKCKNPEAIIKMENLVTERLFGKTADLQKYRKNSDGIELFKYVPFMINPPTQNMIDVESVDNALSSGDTSNLTVGGKTLYADYVKYQKEGSAAAAAWSNYENCKAWDVIRNYYIPNKLGILDQKHGGDTDTMIEKNATLLKMENEMIVNVIMGASMDEFDKFVANWKKLGGDTITQEVNGLYGK
jgi:putative aldouronate transport system substrate-binding protein